MSKEFTYHQRAATTEYRDNWDRIYGKKKQDESLEDSAPKTKQKEESNG